MILRLTLAFRLADISEVWVFNPFSFRRYIEIGSKMVTIKNATGILTHEIKLWSKSRRKFQL